MSGYTKGPWSAIYMPEEGGDYVITGANGIGVALSIGGTVSEKANARLIAAAPELLGALELFVKLRDEGMSNDYYMMRDAVEAARKTIAKARGEA